MKRLIVGMTGATGAIFGIRLLQALKDADVETHLVLSKWAQRTVEHETGWTLARVKEMCSEYHPPGDMAATISSGSFLTEGMVIIPCSMRTLASVAHGIGDHLIHRAADVILKERRRLVVVARETPLSEVHLENMLKLARMGATILPPMPAFYNRPSGIEDIVDHVVARVLDQLGIETSFGKRWNGKMTTSSSTLVQLK